MALIYAVEDDKNILEIEMFALKNSGYQVDGFECARDFYKKLKSGSRIWSFWISCCRMRTVLRSSGSSGGGRKRKSSR